ncbi:MAG TPA: hypothetical protein VFA43_10865 [Gemmatimonadaceae bacterium]|nr:hypothetical protein [Gemmatimonadaceae bacterium]
MMDMKNNLRGLPLAFAALAACSSDSITGTTGRGGEVLETRVSSTSVSVGDALEVTLRISNRSSHTIPFIYQSQYTYAQLSQGATIYAAALPETFAAPDSSLLMPKGQNTLEPTAVVFSTGMAAIGPSEEVIPLTPGTYTVKACAIEPSSSSTGPQFTTECGNGVTITVTPMNTSKVIKTLP